MDWTEPIFLESKHYAAFIQFFSAYPSFTTYPTRTTMGNSATVRIVMQAGKYPSNPAVTVTPVSRQAKATFDCHCSQLQPTLRQVPYTLAAINDYHCSSGSSLSLSPMVNSTVTPCMGMQCSWGALKTDLGSVFSANWNGGNEPGQPNDGTKFTVSNRGASGPSQTWLR